MKKSRAKSARPRPKLLKVSDPMRRLAALLLDEVRTWPEVTTRPMFGLDGLYRGQKIFAVLPRTRAMDYADTICFKLPRGTPSRLLARAGKDPRIRRGDPRGQGWTWFFLESEQDLRGALTWLDQAWRLAK